MVLLFLLLFFFLFSTLSLDLLRVKLAPFPYDITYIHTFPKATMEIIVPIQEIESAGAVSDTGPDVDTVLIVGPYEKWVGVRSDLVTAASSVLKAMLGREAKQPSGMIEIPLLLDDAEAAEITFDIVHGRSRKHASERSPEALYSLALFVNKYECSKPMEDAFRGWARDMRKKSSPMVWTWAMVSLILRDRNLFARATEVLVLLHSGLYVDLITRDQALPDARTQYRTAGTFSMIE